ncbi:hypothetical protein MBH78_13980 [Oceanimonas sp. NS1]|nr:hypothetical protein [Oceanimonas sp. NS1]
MKASFALLPLRKAMVTLLGAGTLMATGLTQAATTIDLSYNGAPDADKNAVHLFASNLKRLVEEKPMASWSSPSIPTACWAKKCSAWSR